MTDRPVQSVLIASVDLFHGFPFELAFGSPRAKAFDDFRFEQSDDGFGQSVVAAVPRRFRPKCGFQLRRREPHGGENDVAEGKELCVSTSCISKSPNCLHCVRFRQSAATTRHAASCYWHRRD